MNREQRRYLKKHPNTNMNPQQAPQQAPQSEEQRQALDAKLKEVHHMSFSFKELLVIFNVLTKVNATYADFKEISPVIDKIQPIIAVDSNIPPKPLTPEVSLGAQA